MRKMKEILPELANLPKERDQLVSLFEKDADSVEEKVSVWTKWVETFVTEEVPDDVHGCGENIM